MRNKRRRSNENRTFTLLDQDQIFYHGKKKKTDKNNFQHYISSLELLRWNWLLKLCDSFLTVWIDTEELCCLWQCAKKSDQVRAQQHVHFPPTCHLVQIASLTWIEEMKCKKGTYSPTKHRLLFSLLFLLFSSSTLNNFIYELNRNSLWFLLGGGGVQKFLMHCTVEDSSFCHLQPGTELSVSPLHPSPPSGLLL